MHFARCLAAVLALAPLPVTAQAFDGFCGTYVQTTSNAGQCEECRLILADNPGIQFYFVEASNGWTAELTWVEGDETVATGEGVWGPIGPPLGGQGFDIDLFKQGALLRMLMTHHAANFPGTIEATFVCTD